MPTITVNPFAARHWNSDNYSTTTYTPDQLIGLVKDFWADREPTNRGQVMLVPVPPKGFTTPLRKLQPDDTLSAVFAPRREGEEPVIRVGHHHGHTPAHSVKIVLYHHITLGADASSDAEWEIVSINASIEGCEELPMDPVTMSRNFLEMAGGTKAEYSAEEFARAIIFWTQHAMRG